MMGVSFFLLCERHVCSALKQLKNSGTFCQEGCGISTTGVSKKNWNKFLPKMMKEDVVLDGWEEEMTT